MDLQRKKRTQAGNTGGVGAWMVLRVQMLSMSSAIHLGPPSQRTPPGRLAFELSAGEAVRAQSI